MLDMKRDHGGWQNQLHLWGIHHCRGGYPVSYPSVGSGSFVDKAEATSFPKTPNAEAEDEANVKSIVAMKERVDVLAMVRKLNGSMNASTKAPGLH